MAMCNVSAYLSLRFASIIPAAIEPPRAAAQPTAAPAITPEPDELYNKIFEIS